MVTYDTLRVSKGTKTFIQISALVWNTLMIDRLWAMDQFLILKPHQNNICSITI